MGRWRYERVMSEQIWTLVAFLVFAALFVVATIRARRPHEPGRLPIVPWTGVQFASIFIALLVLAHLITLWTGHPLVGRR